MTITFIIDIMAIRVESAATAAAVLEPSGVHFRPVAKAMRHVTAALTESGPSSTSVCAVMIFPEKGPHRPNILLASHRFFIAYKRGLEALSKIGYAVFTHPDQDHVRSLKTKNVGDVRLFWGKGTAEEVKSRIPVSPGIYISFSDLDAGLLKDLDLPTLPKALEDVSLLLQIPHHGSRMHSGVSSPAEEHGKTSLTEKETPNRDTLHWRKRFMEENRCLTSDEVAHEATSQAANRAAIASRWMKEKKIFSIRFDGAQWFPAFQFQDGRPIGAIHDVIGIFPEHASGWELAYFFVTPNMSISGHKPVELLKSDSVRLISLAKRFVHPADVF